MATTRRRRTATNAGPAKRTRPAAKAAPKAAKDVTVYADASKVTDYHKAFARWIVSEVGYDPDSASSQRAAFLRGVSIAVTSRTAFMNSDYLEEWREKNGVAKRGPQKRTVEDEVEEAPARRTRGKAKPVEEDEDFEDDDAEEDEDFEDEEDDSEDEDFEDEDDDSDEDDDFEDEVEEPVPAKARRSPAKKTTPAKQTATPAKRTRAKAAEDDFIF